MKVIKLKKKPKKRDEMVASNVKKIGQIMRVIEKNSIYHGTHLLRVYDGFVCLEKPESTWDKYCALKIKVYPKGTSFKITSKV